MKKNRFEKVIANMKKYGLGQIIISSPDSIFYLLNIWVYPGERMLALYINDDGYCRLFINELFPLDKNPGVDVCVYNDIEDPISYLSENVCDGKILGIDKEWPSHFLIRLMKKKPNLKVEVGSIAIDTARMVKDNDEIDFMREASRINDAAIGKLIEAIKDGSISEIDAGRVLKDIYKNLGAQGFSFEPLICYGKNAAEPHHLSDVTMPNDNSCVIIDIGCKYKNYCSDMTRSFFIGRPDDEYIKIYNLVLQANLAGIAAVKPGLKLSHIDKAARKVIDDAGYGRYFTHRTGHNLGLCVHEYPDVSSVSDVVAQEGMVFSIEPGIYINGKYGVRIEDLVLVTKDGCEVLNRYQKDLKIY